MFDESVDGAGVDDVGVRVVSRGWGARQVKATVVEDESIKLEGWKSAEQMECCQSREMATR